jgi:beta-xylosidase
MRRPVAVLGAIVLLAGCGGGPDGASSPSGGATAGSSAMPSPAGEGSTFTNPVIDEEFPDPYVTRIGDAYYAYATNDGVRNVRLAQSADLVHWEQLGDPLPALPSWSGDTPLFRAQPHKATWAPEVAPTGDGYVMYLTMPALDEERPDGKPAQCIGTAVADAPTGPFVASEEGPLVCQPDLGGSIDPTWFQDEDGTRYLIWKNDGNCCSMDTRFFIQRLSSDGLALEGEPTDLGIKPDRRWEGAVIEAPTLLHRDGTYYLLYSANHFESVFYAVGYATSETITGPYTDAPGNPILESKAPAGGPGHQSVVADDDGDLWLAYHAWDVTNIGYGTGGRRALWIDELVLEDAQLVVRGPDGDPQPVP